MAGGIYLLLGSNLGDKKSNLAAAVEEIGLVCTLVRKSSIYQSEPWGNTHQPDFFNQVLEIATSLNPEQLLEKILSTEERLGRKRLEKWGARIIDIDILCYGDTVLSLPHLVVPHPEIQNRRFALVPLSELDPTWVHPVLGKSISQLLTSCPDTLKVELAL